jgi:hypothetical protein
LSHTSDIADLTGKTSHKVSNISIEENIHISRSFGIHQSLALLIESLIDWLTVLSPSDSGRRTTSGGTGKGGQVSVKQKRCDSRRACDNKNNIFESKCILLTISLRVYSDIDYILDHSTRNRNLTAIHSSWSCVKIESITVQGHSTRDSTFDEW